MSYHIETYYQNEIFTPVTGSRVDIRLRCVILFVKPQ